MKLPYTKSGKCGHLVWQRNRYGQICYPAFVPFNPNTPRQKAIRHLFSTVSQRWRTLAQEQRDLWIASAATLLSKPRLLQCGPLTGLQLFMKVNVALGHRGLPQLDLPPLSLRCPRQPVPAPEPAAAFLHPFVGPALYLRARQLLASDVPALLHPAPT
jgi:hypothetical protein